MKKKMFHDKVWSNWSTPICASVYDQHDDICWKVITPSASNYKLDWWSEWSVSNIKCHTYFYLFNCFGTFTTDHQKWTFIKHFSIFPIVSTIYTITKCLHKVFSIQNQCFIYKRCVSFYSVTAFNKALTIKLLISISSHSV